MGKVLLGLSAGIVLTAAAFLLLVEGPTDVTEDRVVIGNVQSLEGQNPSEASSQVTTSFTADSEGARDTPESESPRVAREELSAELPDGVAPSDFSADAIVMPIPISAEIQLLLETDAGARDTHVQLENEQIDSQWGPTTEARLLTFFSQDSEIIRQFGTPVVHCRSTLCEIQAVASERPNLRPLMIDLFEEAWAAELTFHGIATSSQEDGSNATVIFVRREKAEDSQAQSLASVSSTL